MVSACCPWQTAAQSHPRDVIFSASLRLRVKCAAPRAKLRFMPQPGQVPDEPPPFLGSWRRVYIAVIVYLAVIIAGFFLFTRAYQ